MNNKIHVYFIGAGPGDPELITLKGKRILEQADVIVYAGSLVNSEVLRWAKKEAVIYNSATMTLKQTHEVICNAVSDDLVVARVHTGDPSIYGAIQEQILLLENEGILYEIIPGVSSAFAASAALKREYTIPGITQTVIFTRMEGRTPVPKEETISALSRHRATMVIFLSVRMIEEVVRELSSGYGWQTPVMVVYRASWPDEKIIRGRLCNIVDKVKDLDVTRQALIVVGEVFEDINHIGEKDIFSCLYNGNYSHMFRKVT